MFVLGIIDNISDSIPYPLPSSGILSWEVGNGKMDWYNVLELTCLTYTQLQIKQLRE